MDQKVMNLKELIEVGYLMEANRQFFHPLGLELSVNFDNNEDGELFIVDGRSIPEGLKYDELSDLDSNEKNKNIMNIVRKRFSTRIRHLGYTIQPIILPISNPIPEKYRELAKRVLDAGK
jgi:hypothetical protein